MPNGDSNMQNEIHLVEKGFKNITGVGFNSKSINEQGESSKNRLVSPKSKIIMSDTMSKHPGNLHRKQNKTKLIPWKCHHCGINGHRRPYCYDLYGYPKQHLSSKHSAIKNWKTKMSYTCHVVHTNLRASESWYFNSGCSRHMTGNKNHLGDISPRSTGFVSFGDGGRGQIKGVGKLVCFAHPKLDNVLFVKGLTSNLISISQLCDQGFKVIFNISECLVTDDENNIHMRGERSKDDCYLWIPRKESKICEACQLMSQLKQSQQICSRASELLMDPVADIQDKSEGREGSSYIFVDKKFFDRDRYLLDDVYQRLQRRTNKMRTLSSQPKNVNELRTCMNRSNEDSAGGRNKVLIVNKTEAVVETFVITQKYNDGMSSKMLEHEESILKITSLHKRQMESSSHIFQQYCDKVWVDIANKGNFNIVISL